MSTSFADFKMHFASHFIFLASGVLTGKYNDPNQIPPESRFAIKGNALMQHMRSTLFSEEGAARLEKVKQLHTLAQSLNATVAQLALGWCLSNPNVSTVLTGAIDCP
jgi:aryl-alcohol dehydrogenase-like predicted oxidoreductase